jgi:hypothetical protein
MLPCSAALWSLTDSILHPAQRNSQKWGPGPTAGLNLWNVGCELANEVSSRSELTRCSAECTRHYVLVFFT